MAWRDQENQIHGGNYPLVDFQLCQDAEWGCPCSLGTITGAMIQVRSAAGTQPQALVAAESFLGQSKKQLLRKHGKNIHHRLRKTNNIELIALAQVIRSNTRLFPLGKQLKNNLKLFVHGMDKRLKTAVALKNNGKKQGSRKQHPPSLFVQGNGACSRSLADNLITRNPGPVINTQQQTVNRYFIPLDPHASPIHNTKKEADQYKETQPVVKRIHSRDCF